MMDAVDGGDRTRGPYGTNIGDKWLGEGSPIQALLDDDGLVLIHEMMFKDGSIQECVYTTADPELIAAAVAGHGKYMAEMASWS